MTYKDILAQRAKKNKQVKALDVLSPYQILLSPLMTEKSYKDQEKKQKYSFKVHGTANKNDIKVAIKAIYNIVPLSVNMLRVTPKTRANRGLVRKSYKKAVITLSEGQKLEMA